MAKAVWQRTIADDEGNAVPLAEVTFRYSDTGDLAVIYSDRDGTVSPGNPKTANPDGFIRVYLNPGRRYEITATDGVYTDTWEDSVPESEPSTINIESFGAKGDGSVDNTSFIQEAADKIDSRGGGIMLIPEGTFVSGQVTLPSNITIRGEGFGSIVKLKAATNAPLFINKSGSTGSESNITIENLKIDGNKANQTALQEGTGIKLLKVPRVTLRNLWIVDTEGHGIHLNNSGATIEGQVIADCIIEDTGSSAVGTFGSCVAVTNGTNLSISNVKCYDSAKAAFRLSGTGYTITNSHGIRCGNGGLVPEASSFSDSTISNCVFTDNGTNPNNDGIRLVGATNITVNGGVCSGNYGAGLMILNGCKQITVNGGIYKNNGKHADAPAATEGRDGITIKDNGTACTDITITGARCYDDQGSPTQDYGISIQGAADFVTIEGNVLRGNQTGPLRNASTAGTVVRIGSGNIGLNYLVSDNSTNSVTGTTSETTLKTASIGANEIGRRNAFRVRGAGTISGTNGAKTVRLKFSDGSTTFTKTVSSQLAAAIDNWIFECNIHNTASNSQRINTVAWQAAAVEVGAYDTNSVNCALATTITITGELANASDTINVTMFNITPL
jgi:hypothetical protein